MGLEFFLNKKRLFKKKKKICIKYLCDLRDIISFI